MMNAAVGVVRSATPAAPSAEEITAARRELELIRRAARAGRRILPILLGTLLRRPPGKAARR